MEYGLESRLYWPRGGFCPGSKPGQRSGPRRTPGSGVGGPGAAGVRLHVPTTPGSLQEPSGPASLEHGPSSSSVLGTGIPLPLPTQSPYPPCIPTLYTHPTTTSSTCRARPYSRFWTVVGEPRGVGTQPVIGSQAGYIGILRFTRPFDWVSDTFY